MENYIDCRERRNGAGGNDDIQLKASSLVYELAILCNLQSSARCTHLDSCIFHFFQSVLPKISNKETKTTCKICNLVVYRISLISLRWRLVNSRRDIHPHRAPLSQQQSERRDKLNHRSAKRQANQFSIQLSCRLLADVCERRQLFKNDSTNRSRTLTVPQPKRGLYSYLEQRRREKNRSRVLLGS